VHLHEIDAMNLGFGLSELRKIARASDDRRVERRRASMASISE
jgi:hypothetical protein